MDLSMKFNHLRNDIYNSERFICSTRIGKSALMMDVKIFEDKYISTCVD